MTQQVQVYGYLEVFKKYACNYDWFAYFDVDEYLELKQDNTIDEYLSRECFNDYNTILVNWLIYDDNDLIYYEDKPLQERFTRKRYDMIYGGNLYLNNIFKSFIRGNKNGKNNNMCVHYNQTHLLFTNSNNKCDKLCNNCGQKIDNNSIVNVIYFNEDLAVLKHYYFKTLEEYIDQYVNKNKTIYNQYMKFDICNFFNYNRNYLTKEKLKYILKYYIDLL